MDDERDRLQIGEFLALLSIAGSKPTVKPAGAVIRMRPTLVDGTDPSI